MEHCGSVTATCVHAEKNMGLNVLDVGGDWNAFFLNLYGDFVEISYLRKSLGGTKKPLSGDKLFQDISGFRGI